MVRVLLQRDTNGSRLVELVADIRRVVLFNSASRMLEPIPFDQEGIYKECVEVLSRRLSDSLSWVEVNVVRLSWVYLHFRWVHGLDDAGRS